MPSYYRKYLVLLVVSISVFSFACSSKIEAPQEDYAKPIIDTIKEKDSVAVNTSANTSTTSELNKSNKPEVNLEQEAQIEKLCLAAWRKCIAGNKKEGIAELKHLSQKYPQSSSVFFMTGQVLERFGDKNDKKAAMAYYEKAANDSDFAAMSLFKIAESLANSGNTTQAIERYRKLIDIAPQFSLAHLGLAKVLMKLDPKSAEAKKELKITLDLEPTNKEAAALLSTYNS